MQVRLFTIPVADGGEMLAEMNRFLANSKVLEIEQHFCQNDNGAYWSFCVRYIVGLVNSSQVPIARQKPDYKELLAEREFAVFSSLRECRKQMKTKNKKFIISN